MVPSVSKPQPCAVPTSSSEKVTPDGTLVTVAGTGTDGYGGDGGPAMYAKLNAPQHVDVDSAGNVFIADAGNNRIRVVWAATGLIETLAGSGAAGWSGDGGPAESATLNGPWGVHVDRDGNVIERYAPTTEPAAIAKDIEKLLG